MTRALFIGRFQPFHNAHLADVKKILEECDEIVIAIGSSREKNTLENPFSYDERKQMIEKTLKSHQIKNFKIYSVPDLYDDRKWVGYIRKNLPKFDCVYSGNKWTLKCFSKHDFSVKKIRLIKGVSSTRIRDRIIKSENWGKMVPKEISDYLKKINGIDRIKN
jgi:nicotinamide-nucleotide adenylyltransferase